jgi:hypothetical protein
VDLSLSHAEERSERCILHQKDACKFNTKKLVNRKALPELGAISLARKLETMAS